MDGCKTQTFYVLSLTFCTVYIFICCYKFKKILIFQTHLCCYKHGTLWIVFFNFFPINEGVKSRYPQCSDTKSYLSGQVNTRPHAWNRLLAGFYSDRVGARRLYVIHSISSTVVLAATTPLPSAGIWRWGGGSYREDCIVERSWHLSESLQVKCASVNTNPQNNMSK